MSHPQSCDADASHSRHSNRNGRECTKLRSESNATGPAKKNNTQSIMKGRLTSSGDNDHPCAPGLTRDNRWPSSTAT